MKELKWLDLSFNLIRKIEGLEKLEKLTDLSLYSNQIEVIEGLDKLKNLNVFSFGKNLVTNLDETTKYFRNLNNNLQVLNMEDNPFNYQG